MNRIATFVLCMGFLGVACMVSSQEAGSVFSHKVGLFTVSLLAESQGQGGRGILIGATDEMMDECAPTGTFANGMNAFLVQTPGRNVLVDAGLGRRLLVNLEVLGVRPGDVDVVLLTHMHGDHIGGLLKDGEAVFANAVVYLSRQEYAYWMSDAKFRQQQEVIAVYGERLRLFDPCVLGDEATALFTGFTGFAAYGHTPGHTVFLVESEGDRLLIWGDVTHAMALQMPYPEVGVTYDVDVATAVESRKQTLGFVVAEGIAVAGMHVPFPSMGLVARGAKGGYVFSPFSR